MTSSVTPWRMSLEAAAVDDQALVGPAQHVDEAGRDGLPAGVDDARLRARGMRPTETISVAARSPTSPT